MFKAVLKGVFVVRASAVEEVEKMAWGAMSIFLSVLGVVFLFLSAGVAYASTQTFATSTKRELQSKSETLFDEQFDLDVEDYKALHFTLDKGRKVTVKWDWSVDEDYEINWYLLEDEEYEKWRDEEDFSHIADAKNSYEDSGEVVLEDGDYVFLFNNAENDEEVSTSFEATIEWEVEVVIESKRNMVEEWFPYVLACDVLSFLSFLGSLFSRGGRVPEEEPL